MVAVDAMLLRVEAAICLLLVAAAVYYSQALKLLSVFYWLLHV
jgi:hypothetical protein